MCSNLKYHNFYRVMENIKDELMFKISYKSVSHLILRLVLLRQKETVMFRFISKPSHVCLSSLTLQYGISLFKRHKKECRRCGLLSGWILVLSLRGRQFYCSYHPGEGDIKMCKVSLWSMKHEFNVFLVFFRALAFFTKYIC